MGNCVGREAIQENPLILSEYDDNCKPIKYQISEDNDITFYCPCVRCYVDYMEWLEGMKIYITPIFYLSRCQQNLP